MANEQKTEADFEAMLNAVDLNAEPEVIEEEAAPAEEVEAEPEVIAAPTDADETAARKDGWVPYEDWKAAGKDPRAWRPADEFNRRGEMLRTGKPELIDQVEKLTRAQERQAELIAEQIRISKQAQAEAERRGYEAAIRDAQEQQDLAIKLGDTDAARKAFQQEQEARQAIQQQQAPDPRQDPELVRWQDESKWFKEGFDAQGKPATPVVELFLELQKAHMLSNPNARIIDSVRIAEDKVKRMMPDHFKPKTPQARTAAPTVDAGARAPARPGNDPLAKYNVSERKLIQDLAKSFGKTTTEYLKMIEG